MSTVALVESPAQLLNVVEWAHQRPTPADRCPIGADPRPARPRPVGGSCAAWPGWPARPVSRCAGTSRGSAVRRRPYGAVAGRRPRRRRPAGPRRPVLGRDAGRSPLCRTSEVMLVDDGTATLEFARQWAAGEPLRRWHQVAAEEHRRQITTFARDQIAGLAPAPAGDRARAAGSPSSAACRWRSAPRGCCRNTLRLAAGAASPATGQRAADLVGTSLVETGVVSRGRVPGRGGLAGRPARRRPLLRPPQGGPARSSPGSRTSACGSRCRSCRWRWPSGRARWAGW